MSKTYSVRQDSGVGFLVCEGDGIDAQLVAICPTSDRAKQVYKALTFVSRMKILRNAKDSATAYDWAEVTGRNGRG